MSKEVLNFIQSSSFPCIMAKAAVRTGYIEIQNIPDIKTPQNIAMARSMLYSFIDHFRLNQNKLSSFILQIEDEALTCFNQFETSFYAFLREIYQKDKIQYPHDPRVSADIYDSRFSFSLKSEAFFIVALHPESPRWARRFKSPAIVFNPHIQFEKLREKNLFHKIKNIIRSKDRLLQGSINPMLNDFGERSEVFQYLGKVYGPHDRIPLIL